ncbi:MAG: acetyl-CoA C-acetyltransferase [Dehalococcoidia bacterium]
MSEVVIVSGSRTAIGSFGGALKDVPVCDLGSLVIRNVLTRVDLRPRPSAKLLGYGPKALANDVCDMEELHNKWPDNLKDVEVDEVIMGCVYPQGQRQNVVRRAAIFAGMPKETPAYGLNKLCGSGMEAVVTASQKIMAGDAEVILAGGMDSMSNVPYALPRARWGYRMDVGGKAEFYDLLIWDALMEGFHDYHMGVTSENIAAKYGITREEQDKLALMSHQRALAAIKSGVFKQEIVPVMIRQRKGDPIAFDTDERPMETSLEKLTKLPSAFIKNGTVTAGNSSGLNDAAAAVLLMSNKKAKAMGLEPIVKIKAHASAGVDPAYMGLGVIPAVWKVLEKAKLTIKDLDIIELNEAFAAQALGCLRELPFDMNKVNTLGSGISLGHPVGATGTRLLVTMGNEMKRRNLKYGLATMCIGGGMGIAMIVER